MSTHDEARRSFLIGAVVGAGAAGFVSDASGQEKGQQNKPADVAPSSRTSSNGDERGAFFNAEDAQTVSAFAERLMPGAPGKPGAREAGVLNYIDLALAGAGLIIFGLVAKHGDIAFGWHVGSHLNFFK